MKKLNSKDIAQLAGVSRSTVSRVINGYPNVPEETHQRVMRVIRENHYYPQLSGQMLNGMPTKTIGLFWLTKSSIAMDALSSYYFLTIVDAAASRSYLVLSCVVNNLSEQKNVDFVRRVFMEGRIDGGIFIGAENNEPLVGELISAGKIVGLFDYCREDEASCRRITVNFERDSGEKCVDYLYKMGHRKIAVIDGDMSRFSSICRHESFLRGMQRHGLLLRNEWLTYGGITKESGYQAARRMLLDCGGCYPTAVCANNDAVAFGVYQACAELGLRVPDDISVIGIDGHIRGTEVDPPLTTIGFDFQAMFGSLVNRVIDSVEQEPLELLDEFCAGALWERASVRPVKES